MEHRWYKAWPVWVPKTIEIDRPASEYIRHWAKFTPDKIALTFYGRNITYTELDNMTDRLAWGLVNLGVKRGDRVAIHMENCPQFVISYFAIQRAGGVVVPISPMFKEAEIEYEINDSGAETLIGMDTLYFGVEKIRSRTNLKNIVLAAEEDFLPVEPFPLFPVEGRREKHFFSNIIPFLELIQNSQDIFICNVVDLKTDLAQLQYTGGTTGIPKGAMITHYALSYSAVAVMHWYHFRENDVFLGVAPFFHVMGQGVGMYVPLITGAQITIDVLTG